MYVSHSLMLLHPFSLSQCVVAPIACFSLLLRNIQRHMRPCASFTAMCQPFRQQYDPSSLQYGHILCSQLHSVVFAANYMHIKCMWGGFGGGPKSNYLFPHSLHNLFGHTHLCTQAHTLMCLHKPKTSRCFMASGICLYHK